MGLLNKIRRSNFVIRLKSWEYWPFGILQFPLFFYWIWLSLRARSPFFFTASNPGIPMGGMLGESKYAILKKIPNHLIPTTVLIEMPSTSQQLFQKMNEANLRFPVIFKPDIGERGWNVVRINNGEEATRYISRIQTDFIIQSLVELPFEFGVFYRRYPSEISGRVISVVEKEMLGVTGDGMTTLKELIMKNDRAKLQWKKLRATFHNKLYDVVPAATKIELVSIGNHARGTKFLNGNYLINDRLSHAFDTISRQIDGFFYGRFDVRAASTEDLTLGNVIILELNGCGAEQAHMYDPHFGLINAIRLLFRHWRDIFRISRENHANGVPYMSVKEGIRYYRKFKAVIRQKV
jgi:hypothetical protein